MAENLNAVLWQKRFITALSSYRELQIREEVETDAEFIASLYCEYRWQELQEVPWDEAQKKSFLASQAKLQTDHYRRNYPGALYLIFETNQSPIGRLYLYASESEYRLMEVLFLAAYRGQGIGTRLIRALLAQAQLENRRVTLHVEPNNPAQRLYRRMGFELSEDRGAYHFLSWTPAGLG